MAVSRCIVIFYRRSRKFLEENQVMKKMILLGFVCIFVLGFAQLDTQASEPNRVMVIDVVLTNGVRSLLHVPNEKEDGYIYAPDIWVHGPSLHIGLFLDGEHITSAATYGGVAHFQSPYPTNEQRTPWHNMVVELYNVTIADMENMDVRILVDADFEIIEDEIQMISRSVFMQQSYALYGEERGIYFVTLVVPVVATLDTTAYEYAPVIDSITVSPPGIFPGCDLEITLTNVYDVIGRADLAGQSTQWFYLTPQGSFSISRGAMLLAFRDDDEFTVLLQAGDVFDEYGFTSLSFHYGDFPVEDHHYATMRHHRIAFHVVNEGDRTPVIWENMWATDRVSFHDVDAAEFDAAPLIDSITVRAQERLPGCDLVITLTDVYNVIGRADIMMQSAQWFYLAPTGSFSLNRDVELSTTTGDAHQVIQLAAGEVFDVYGFKSLSFQYGEFPITDDPFADYGLYRQHHITFHIANDGAPPALQDGLVPDFLVTFHAIGMERVLRFEIDNTTYTDRGVSITLEAAPFIAYDRTMVPLRVIIEAMGAADVSFVDGVVSFVVQGFPISLTIGQPLPGGFGTPVIIADRTFVPLAYVMDAVGANVRWDGTNRAAYIYIA